ncbi:helix-turn-helix domain-containing protein [Streptomyces sp. NPDC017529]|uniref:helix-turn-helix domain-containing protein n=1 Tax=Streptomyces sp. NPDC017529 TaxID=3365000 RepID=UPI0037A16692
MQTLSNQVPDRGRPALGPQLRALRLAARLSQKQLADVSTLSVRAIRDIENGRVRQPRRDTCRLLVKALDLRTGRRDALRVFDSADTPAPGADAPAGLEPLAPPVGNGPLIGRRDELSTLTRLFTTEQRRLITLTGIGGVGKSRLAQELARTLYERDGTSVLWVRLDEAAGGGRPQGGVAAAVSARARELVHTGPEGARRIGELLGDGDTLLVLDGARSYGELAGLVPPLHGECPRLRVLITARSATGTAANAVFPLAPLPVPLAEPHPCVATTEANASVQVFLTYVQHMRPAFRLNGANVAAVVRTCRALDGLPMALELAARWSLVYSPWQLARQLAADPLLVTRPPEGWAGGVPGVLESVRDAVDALTHRQGALLTAMLKRGGYWTMAEAAEAVGTGLAEAADDTYALLLHGLLRRTDCAGQTLFETLNIVRSLRTGRPVAAT